jgi:uncharacterized protein
VKLFLVLAVGLLLVWLWRSGRNASNDSPDQAQQHPDHDTSSMVACKHCGLHLPETEAVKGLQGMYCSLAHMHQQEG